MELGEHEQNEPPVADCDCRRCAVATRDALRKDAERYRWLRERWGRISETYEANTPILTEIGDEQDGWDTDGESLDRCIDAAMTGANKYSPER